MGEYADVWGYLGSATIRLSEGQIDQQSDGYSSTVLASTVTETTNAMIAAQSDPTYKPYDRDTFTVSLEAGRWKRVSQSSVDPQNVEPDGAVNKLP
jgi:hypothetical protein